MEFVMLESRGGNYLVVAENVAWLRTAENGQTSVGIVGGQPLLVVGSIQEVADKVLNAAAEAKASAAEPAPAARPAAAEPVLPQSLAEAASPAPAAAPPHSEPEPAPEVVAAASPPAKPGERPLSGPGKPMSLSDRLALATTPKVKAGSQRLMGMTE